MSDDVSGFLLHKLLYILTTDSTRCIFHQLSKETFVQMSKHKPGKKADKENYTKEKLMCNCQVSDLKKNVYRI